MKTIFHVFVLVFLSGAMQAQTFINGDLDGDASVVGGVPHHWQAIDFNDPNCLAHHAQSATPDLATQIGPNGNIGLFGFPYSGKTFLSGLYLTFQGAVWHEGIQQTVNGFSPDSSYTLHFHQTVVKQNNALDSSGSWIVYMDGAVLGITPPTFSPLPYDDPNLPWEAQSIVFTASSASHTFMFLPFDDDTTAEMSISDGEGGLRMGLDRIFIERNYPCEFDFSLGNDTLVCEGESLILGNLFPNGWYAWEDFSNGETFTVTHSGSYSVEITLDGCSNRDTIEVTFEDCSGNLVMPNVFTPNGDGHNDTFQPMETHHIHTLKTSIFDRWGVRIITSDQLNIDWNGSRDQGGRAQPGVYFWVAEYVDDENNSGTKSGNVTLLR